MTEQTFEVDLEKVLPNPYPEDEAVVQDEEVDE